MNILLLNHYAGSPALGMEYRPYYLAREWVRMGHRVRVMAASFSHVRTRQPAMAERATDAPIDEEIDGIAYRWLPTPRYSGNGLGRMKNIVAFLRQLWAGAAQLAREFKPDVVIASSTYPMDIWVARRIARRARATLVWELHDLWPLSPIELSGMPRWHPFALLCQAAEDAACRDADCVVSMLPKVHQHLAGRGLDLRKLAIVPNGISTDEWALEPETLRGDVAKCIARSREAGEAVVGYAGSMGLPNALDGLLDAAKLLSGEKLHFVLVGDGHERERLAQRIQAQGLANVSLLPPIPKCQVPSFLSRIDVAYIGWQRVPIYRFGIAPNKLMDYMMAGCVVLHSVDAGNDPVAEAGCGLSVPPQDPSAVAAGIRTLLALGAEERRVMGERGRAFVREHHAYDVLARRFLQAVQGAARS